MSTWIWITLGTVVVGLVAGTSLRPKGLSHAIKTARRTGDLSAIVGHIEHLPEAARPTTWDNAIGQLWRAYERETAARLVIEAGLRSDAEIVQYWIRQVMEVEPEIAMAVFTPEFLNSCFNPSVASSMGRCGSCGCG